jgi:hypothetical protein
VPREHRRREGEQVQKREGDLQTHAGRWWRRLGARREGEENCTPAEWGVKRACLETHASVSGGRACVCRYGKSVKGWCNVRPLTKISEATV